jgi:glucose/mannose transport system substrate-binding protein
MRLSRKGLVALGLVAALGALPACSSKANESSDKGSGNKVEVFSWWTGPGEEEGLNAMIEDFKKNNAGVEVVNAAVSGGAGTNAKAILANRLQAKDAPTSYQRHAGLELADDIKAGQVDDITSLY